MTLLQLATEIEFKLLNNRPFKKFENTKKAEFILTFYECDTQSVTYKFDNNTWEKIKKLIKIKI